MKLKGKIRKYNEPIILAVGTVILLFYLALACIYYFRYSLKDLETAGGIFGFGFVGVAAYLLLFFEKKAKIVTNVFICICSIFFMCASVMLYINSVRHYNSVKDLIDSHQYVYAEYDHIESSYYTVLKYTDENSGENYYFQTHSFKWKSNTPVKKGEAVKVYVDLSNPDLYLISYKEKK